MSRWKTKWRAKACPSGHEYSPENTGVGAKGERVCKTCQRERMRRKRANPDFLKRQAEATARWRKNNPQHREQAKAARQSKYEWVNNLKASLKCAKCGEAHPACLEFHHRDRKDKRATISLVIWRWSRKRLMAEIEKCDVLCSNCHRKLHWEERQGRNEDLWPAPVL